MSQLGYQKLGLDARAPGELVSIMLSWSAVVCEFVTTAYSMTEKIISAHNRCIMVNYYVEMHILGCSNIYSTQSMEM